MKNNKGMSIISFILIVLILAIAGFLLYQMINANILGIFPDKSAISVDSASVNSVANSIYSSENQLVENNSIQNTGELQNSNLYGANTNNSYRRNIS